MRKVLAGVSLILLVGGCHAEPRIVRWHADAEAARRERVRPGVARITAFVTDPAPTADGGPAIQQLPPGAQNTLLSRLAERTQTVDELLRVLAHPLGGHGPAPGAPIDRTRIRKRIVFAVEKSTLRMPPADRIGKVLATLDVSGPGVIRSWNRFETEWGAVDLGRLVLDQREAASVDVGADAGDALPFGLGVDAAAEHEAKLREELALSRRVVALTGTLEPGGRRARLFQEGSPRIDLAGNFFIEVEVELDALEPREVFVFDTARPGEDGDVPRAQTEVGFTRVPARLPSARDAVTARVGGAYLLRRVHAGATTIIEGDDRVEPLIGTFPSCTVELVDTEELRRLRTVWQLVIGQPRVDPPLHIARRRGPNEISHVEPLSFGDPAEAARLRDWLLVQAESAGDDGGDDEVRIGRHHVLVRPVDAALRADGVPSVRMRTSRDGGEFEVLTPEACWAVAVQITD